MSTSSNSPVVATVHEFKALLAKALLKEAQTEQVAKSGAGVIARGLGLPQPVAKSDEGYEIPEIPQSETINGYKRTDFTPEKLAELDAKALWDAQREAYMYLVDMAKYGGNLSEAAVVRVCEATGLPVSVTKTQVTVTVTGFGTARWTVDGKVSEERKTEIRAHFLPKVVDPIAKAIRELDPNARGLTDGVTASYSESHSWPAFPAFAAPGSTTA